MELSGRVAVVTGGGTGLGAEVSRQLAAAGVRVGVNWSRSRDAAEALAATLGPDAAVAVQGDVRDGSAVASMFARVASALGGPVDLLVNNAGVTVWAPGRDLDAVTSEDWDRILGVNVVGAWNCIRALAPGMRARGTGAVVNVASDSVYTLDGSSIPYVVSKFAVVGLTRTLARALAPAVRVNAVAPGWMDTPWLDRYAPDDVARAVRGGTHPAVPVEEVAKEVVRLLGDDDATGQITQLSA